jgi:hypothetical protein
MPERAPESSQGMMVSWHALAGAHLSGRCMLCIPSMNQPSQSLVVQSVASWML